MDDKTKLLQFAMNDYLVSNNAEHTVICDNLALFYNLSIDMQTIFAPFFDGQNKDVDYSKISRMSFTDKINLIKNFYRENNIDFDIDYYLNDGTIDFKYYDYFNDNEDLELVKLNHLVRGNATYQGTKKIVNICNNGFVTDVLIAVHELSHFRDKSDNHRNQVSDLLTESLAYAEELICSDYIAGLGYKEEEYTWKKNLYNIFYHGACSTRIICKMFLVFENLGDISEASYESYYGNTDEYDDCIRYLNQDVASKDFELRYHILHVLGATLGTYMYYEYKKDKSFIDHITKLHTLINTTDAISCFKEIGLNNLNKDDHERLVQSLELMATELSIGNKKL